MGIKNMDDEPTKRDDVLNNNGIESANNNESEENDNKVSLIDEEKQIKEAASKEFDELLKVADKQNDQSEETKKTEDNEIVADENDAPKLPDESEPLKTAPEELDTQDQASEKADTSKPKEAIPIGDPVAGDIAEKKPAKTSIAKYIIWGAVAVLVCCLMFGGVYKLRTYNKNEAKPEESSDANSTEILFNKDSLPRVDASLATQPLMDAFVKDFTGSTTTDLGIEYTNTHPAYEKLVNNETDLIIVTQPSDEEKALAEEKNVELEITKVVNEGFVFFVNTANPVDNVTFKQIQDIYTGDITNWKDVGGNDAGIIAYQRPVNSGSQTGLLNLVMQGRELMEAPKTEEELTMAGIIEYVANYDGAENAIGFSYYYYANQIYSNDKLKFLAIDGVAPSYETIQNQSYPIMTAYYIVTRKGESNENVSKLKDAMLSARGQKIAKEADYVPTE